MKLQIFVSDIPRFLPRFIASVDLEADICAEVRCNGARPCCRHCLRLNDRCRWPAIDSASSQLASSSTTASIPETASSSVDGVSEAQSGVLLDVFFSTSHLAFIRQSFHQPSISGFDLQTRHPFLFASISSLAATYISDDDIIHTFNGETSYQLSDRMAAIAQQHSRASSDRPSLSAVQANVVLGFRELCRRNITQAWMYTGHALRMAQEMRLGKEYFQGQASKEREIRRRAYWTCFTMDRMLCFLTARPQVLRSRHISIQLPCPTRSFVLEEAYRGPSLKDISTYANESIEVLPFFLVAVDLWGKMMDLFGTVGNISPEGLTEDESEFYECHIAVLKWIENLPAKMTWSAENYKIFRLLGEGSLFVSMHMVLGHALCTLQQAHLPQDHEWLSGSTPDSGWKQDIAAICCFHANVIAEIARTLHNGDDIDKDALRSPFSGAAIVSSACVLLWSLNATTTTTVTATPNMPNSSRIAELLAILKSWQTLWPIASSWVESVELISVLYAVAYGASDPELQQSSTTTEENLNVGVIGLPQPSTVSPRLFEKIRHIMFTISEPRARRQIQSRLHVRNLWSHMCLQAQTTSIMVPQPAQNVNYDLEHELTDSPEVPFGWDQYMSIFDIDQLVP
jgi:hypothetical protein